MMFTTQYDFHKTVQDPAHGEFTHTHFKRGRPDLLVHIKRKAHNKEPTGPPQPQQLSAAAISRKNKANAKAAAELVANATSLVAFSDNKSNSTVSTIHGVSLNTNLNHSLNGIASRNGSIQGIDTSVATSPGTQTRSNNKLIQSKSTINGLINTSDDGVVSIPFLERSLSEGPSLDLTSMEMDLEVVDAAGILYGNGNNNSGNGPLTVLESNQRVKNMTATKELKSSFSPVGVMGSNSASGNKGAMNKSSSKSQFQASTSGTSKNKGKDLKAAYTYLTSPSSSSLQLSSTNNAVTTVASYGGNESLQIGVSNSGINGQQMVQRGYDSLNSSLDPSSMLHELLQQQATHESFERRLRDLEAQSVRVSGENAMLRRAVMEFGGRQQETQQRLDRLLLAVQSIFDQSDSAVSDLSRCVLIASLNLNTYF